MDNRLLIFILSVVVHLCRGKEQVVNVMCSDLIKSHSSLRTMNPSECNLSFKNDHLTCTVRLMSESIPFNVTDKDTDYSSLVRVNLNYSFKFRVVGGEVQGEVRRRCLVLTGVSFRRVSSGTGERRTKVLLPSRLFHLAANSAILGADSEVDAEPGIPAGVVTLRADCSTGNSR